MGVWVETAQSLTKLERMDLSGEKKEGLLPQNPGGKIIIFMYVRIGRGFDRTNAPKLHIHICTWNLVGIRSLLYEDRGKTYS